MLAYLIRRLGAVLLMVLVVLLTTFSIFFLLPKWAGQDTAVLFAGKATGAEQLEGIRQKLGLDEPVLVQFWDFVKGIPMGRDYANGGDVTRCDAPCFGYSFRTEEPVWDTLKDALPVTGALAAGACVMWLVGGVAIGVLSALRRGSVWDRSAMVGALSGVSMPIFFTGMVMMGIFVHSLGWLKIDDDLSGADGIDIWLQSLILPWIALAFLYAAMYARLTRATMLEVLGEDYIRTARAKGLGEPSVIRKHALRSAMTPILTVFGLDLGALLGGAVLTEQTFGLKGLGFEAVDAISNKDLPVILGVTLIAALAIAVANLVVDIMYAVIDPRVRLS
ncbi:MULTISPECIES: ABC transporter permease [Streptomyces]|uniref:Oligopeptide transport system integral membrane protein n=2 Tax=Streptomyces TaxID=1883 RepID=A0A0B5EIR2_STRA4|nr:MULTISPECIES: ABC transporter permease [Streptomyces]AJE82153.1 oligopeptide transport system integral membrane protein [Streptomyces albus]AOU76468.1 oligopeptide transport system integral membrane protein [Streptomyces albus]AYN32255.1 ABC transporter permease [Streptomyces albus]NKI44842.1 ABC transporter permease [Streptomyces physcomitrii]